MDDIFIFNYSNSYSFYNEYSHNICIYNKETKKFETLNKELHKCNHQILNIMNYVGSTESVEYNCIIFKKQEQFSYCTYRLENIENGITMELTINDKDFNFHDILSALKEYFDNIMMTSFEIKIAKEEKISTILEGFKTLTYNDENGEPKTSNMFYLYITEEDIMKSVDILNGKNI